MIQENADINTEDQAQALSEVVETNRNRASQYESDLNTAKDQIEKAQTQMKNIDSEVQNF